MKVIQVTTAFARHDDELEFDELDELVDATGYDVDDESDTDELVRAAEDEDNPPYVYADPDAGSLRWSRRRGKAVEALSERDDVDDGEAEHHDEED